MFGGFLLVFGGLFVFVFFARFLIVAFWSFLLFLLELACFSKFQPDAFGCDSVLPPKSRALGGLSLHLAPVLRLLLLPKVELLLKGRPFGFEPPELSLLG